MNTSSTIIRRRSCCTCTRSVRKNGTNFARSITWMIPAVCRPSRSDENPLYYDLIKTFGKKTGIPVVLNTSFNENEPIVCTPAEAIDCFKRTKMDVLAIGPFLALKTDN